MEYVIAFLVLAAVVVAFVRYVKGIEVRDDMDDYDFDGELPRNGRDDRAGRSQP